MPQNSANAADVRAALLKLGFTPRLSRDQDVRETQFSIHHPQSELVELVAYIDVKNVFYKDAEYHSMSIFTLVKGLPLNILNHPLNINVGFSETHDAALFSGMVEAITTRFRSMAVEDEVLNWYSISYAA